MADYGKKPSDPRGPLLFRLGATAWGPDPASPAGGGGNGYFVCRLSTGSSALVNAYDWKPGPLSAREGGGPDGWWDDWWGDIEKSWDKTSADVSDWFKRAGQVKLAFELAFTSKRVMGAIEKETGMLAAALPAALYAGLKHIGEVLLTSTLAGAVVGGVVTIEAGGVGAMPGGVLGFELGVLYLEVTGLAEVAAHLADNLDEVLKRLRLGVERAWDAGRYGRPMSEDITAAADIMAGSIGVLFRLVLEAIAAALLVKGIGKTVSSLAEGQFGKEFALWVEQNQKALTTNPKLKPKAKSKGGAAEGEAAAKSESGGASKSAGSETRGGAASKPKVQFPDRQLQKKFKHAEDFGVEGNYSPANARKFQSAMESHINSPATKVVEGTYHGQPVTHYVNPGTGLNVIQDGSGQFVSGWKLSPAQMQHVLTTGSLGGG